MVAFVRCFASLFYTYRKHLAPAPLDKRKAATDLKFNWEAFMKSIPSENATYVAMLRDTQAFNEFIYDRETMPADDPSIRLFDEIILSKRNRGRPSMFSKSRTNFLSDTSNHLWVSAAATITSNRHASPSEIVVGRTAAKLDQNLMREPRVIQGVPQVKQTKPQRKSVPSLLGPGLRTQVEMR